MRTGVRAVITHFAVPSPSKMAVHLRQCQQSDETRGRTIVTVGECRNYLWRSVVWQVLCCSDAVDEAFSGTRVALGTPWWRLKGAVRKSWFECKSYRWQQMEHSRSDSSWSALSIDNVPNPQRCQASSAAVRRSNKVFGCTSALSAESDC